MKGCCDDITLYEYQSFLIHCLSFKDSKPNSRNNFSLDEPLIAPVIANAEIQFFQIR